MVFQEILDRHSWHGQFIKEKYFYIVNVLVVDPNFKHFQQKILPLKMNGWSQKEDTDSIVFKFLSHLIPNESSKGSAFSILEVVSAHVIQCEPWH